MTELHSHPNATELLDATIEFLTDAVTPVVPAEHAFHFRVALNALAMVRRELESTVDDDAAHRGRLAAIGYADDAALAAALRAGEVPADRLPRVRASLLADAEARLRVVNPRFVTDYESTA
ncbi:DUF6285 domain-containing protein [Virgisporangium aurantiacum]|uniref:DUF6285 domain-containing protein n=1 Tax=Virgisporangium aurantiacum TaxID=175570 RepID=A0A8J4E0K9_9ACTN|nr:DUF6285 domain-containing protein [Virgisporangium aurantiacum]GIJ56921.1 hypothetical protein Vau01_044370 [Virgisporangium aurantiacum]